jgi:hypothetical protein
VNGSSGSSGGDLFFGYPQYVNFFVKLLQLTEEEGSSFSTYASLIVLDSSNWINCNHDTPAIDCACFSRT